MFLSTSVLEDQHFHTFLQLCKNVGKRKSDENKMGTSSFCEKVLAFVFCFPS
ncbi:hypothetical protein Fmac_017632 [Flemingia macrophylla]|uniref:Uncharacterized protein n=1 Tax=Flemingia macrophylla TaxID=520843 RepID=A0ABD1M2T9_9FABA